MVIHDTDTGKMMAHKQVAILHLAKFSPSTNFEGAQVMSTTAQANVYGAVNEKCMGYFHFSLVGRRPKLYNHLSFVSAASLMLSFVLIFFSIKVYVQKELDL